MIEYWIGMTLWDSKRLLGAIGGDLACPNKLAIRRSMKRFLGWQETTDLPDRMEFHNADAKLTVVWVRREIDLNFLI